MNDLLNKKAKEVIAQFLDEEFYLSRSRLIEVGWSFIPIYQYLDPLQAEWISNAITETTSCKKILAIDIEYKSEPKAIEFEATRDEILAFLFASTGSVILTNNSVDFLYYKDQINRFSVICGSNKFLRKSYPSSFDTMKVMFYYYWQDDQVFSSGEKDFYQNVWKEFNNLPDVDNVL
jgi:hypothetical protein